MWQAVVGSTSTGAQLPGPGPLPSEYSVDLPRDAIEKAAVACLLVCRGVVSYAPGPGVADLADSLPLLPGIEYAEGRYFCAFRSGV